MTTIAAFGRINSKSAIFYFALLAVLTVNICYSYYSFIKLKEFDYATLNAKLISSKELKNKNGDIYFSLLFRSPQMDFRTYSKLNMKRYEGRYFNAVIKTTNLSFVDLFKTPRLKLESMGDTGVLDNVQQSFKNFIASQHSDAKAREIYLNLFLNSEVSPEIDSFIGGYGLGAFFAISGLNVALLMAFIFFVLALPFRLIQERCCPYVNREFFILLLSFAVLVFYAYLTDFTPSFIRALIASIILFFFALRGDNILSYKTLFFTTAVCIAMFPSFLFSIGFWLSFYGVFLIYLFLAYNKLKNKVLTYVALSSWLFAAMLPIIHYIFALFTKAHLLNSIFSVAFDVFYPLSLVIHIFGIGWIFDSLIVSAVDSSKELLRSEFLTPTWFFILYLATSFASMRYKLWFLVFNTLCFGYLIAVLAYAAL